MQKFSYLKSVNAEYIDEMFGRYLQNPSSIDDSWRYFFEGIELGAEEGAPGFGATEPSTQSQSAPAGAVAAGPAMAATSAPRVTSVGANAEAVSELRVAELILAYRDYGKYLADVNPLSPPPSSHLYLELSRFGLSNADLEKTFAAGNLVGLGQAKLKDILTRLQQTYTRTVAAEFLHIQNVEAREWLQKKMESTGNRIELDAETRKFILKRVTEAEGFERFLHTRYVAQKRFSVEGAEAVIPALDCMIEQGAELGAKEFVLGMAHRGRLNVLTNIMGKKPEYIFTEFEGTYKIDPDKGEGDVKYHKGASLDFTTRKGKRTHLSLAFNPSHLEFVNPVVEGVARAKQARLGDTERAQVMPVLIHGDAAFAGQGVCYETLGLAQLPGYTTGGTLHIVINNQVGFTAEAMETRSTQYCTDLAKMMDAPIFHVNGDDLEAVWTIAQLCTEYRQKFKSDVFIDLICYRKHGHNEGDEPTFTSPMMYKKIKAHASPRELYAKKLVAAGVINDQDAQALVDQVTETLTKAQQKTKAENPQPYTSVLEGAWKGLKQPKDTDIFAPVRTLVDEKTLKEIAAKINQMPSGFHLHSKLARFFEARLKAVEEGKGIDWGNGEALAYASLVREGHSVRVSGQDVQRGTFTHRHSVLHDSETGELYVPFNAVATPKSSYSAYNSHLSEMGVLGFEYGYSLASPETLVVWEAQFGDFANGAQVMIDQFITTSESKWLRMSGITLLLPHGYEGQGPEHSSARLERFLQLSGKQNIIVANLTTPAQIFHALRRQVKRDFRKPLVIMSPKSLLRHPQAVSTLDEFTKTGFQEVIDDREFGEDSAAKKVKRVILCTGKVCYDLAAERTARKKNDVAIVRIEQLYPWPEARLAEVMKRYSSAKEIVWTQEEPRNMGAWGFIFNMWSGGLSDFQKLAGDRPIRYAGREIASSPAVGSHKWHEMEQKALIEKAFS